MNKNEAEAEAVIYMKAINDAREVLINIGIKLIKKGKPEEAGAIGRASKEVAKLLCKI